MDADPKVVLEWLEAKNGDLRALQLTALEQLCNEVLFSDNVDVFCERYPPRCFLPALCRIFLDDQAPPTVLEANARAVSYYLDMHVEWCEYITQSGEVLRALASHLECVDMTSSKSNEFGQQLIKLMKIICNHDPAALYANGGLTAVLQFVRDNLHILHTDVLQAGMDVIRKLFSKADSTDKNLKTWIKALSALLNYRETGVADQTLRAFANLVSRFAQCGADPSPLADPHIIACLLHRLRVAGGVESNSSSQVSELSVSGATDPVASLDAGEQQGTRESVTASVESNPAVVQAVTNILITLCCSSGNVTQTLLTSDGQFATTLAMVLQRSEDETVIMSVLRLVNILLVLLHQNADGRPSASNGNDPSSPDGADESHRRTSSGMRAVATTPSSDSSSATTTTVGECSTPVTVSPSGSKDRSIDSSPCVPPRAVVNDPGSSSSTTPATVPTNVNAPSTPDPPVSTDRDALHRSVIEAIKKQDLDYVKTQVESGHIDINYTDHLGQTLLNWAASFGTPAMVDFLCSRGANVHQGVRSPLDYAATFGRVEVCRTLLARGADPNRRDDQGRRPIDRAREQLPYPGCQQVIDLLEAEVKRVNGRTVPKAKVSTTQATSPTDASSSKDKSQSDAQRIFVHQLFPTLVALFRESVSSAVKRQCLLLVRRMIGFIHPAHLEEISMLDYQNVPFAFSLAQLIYGVLNQETDEFILRALVVSQGLLTKAPRIYVGVFQRLGLFPMIRQLVDIWTHLVPDEKDASQDEKLSTGVDTSRESENAKSPDTLAVTAEQPEDPESAADSAALPNAPIAAEQLQNNQLYYWNDWNLIWVGDLVSMFTPWAFIIIQLQPADGGLRALAIHEGVPERDRMPVMLSPGEPAVQRPGLKSHMLRMHQHLMDASEHLARKPLWPEKSQSSETDKQDRSQRDAMQTSPNARFPPRSSFGKFEASKANWRRVGLHLGLRRPPESPNAPKGLSSRLLHHNTEQQRKNVLQRQASSPARTCLASSPMLPLGTSEKPAALGKPVSVATIGPLVCSLRETNRGSRLCIQARALADGQQRSDDSDASFKEALLFFESYERGFCRVRVSSVYPEGSTTEVEEVSVPQVSVKPKEVEKKLSASGSSPTNQNALGRRRHSFNLLSLMSKVDSELQSDGERSSTDSSDFDGDAPELFDFDALFGSGDTTIERQCTRSGDGLATATVPGKPPAPEVHRELRRIHEVLFPREFVYETYSSGRINGYLSIDADCINAENKDRKERAYKHLTNVRRQALQISKELLNLLSDRTTDAEQDGTTNRNWACHEELRNLRAITSDIWTAYENDKVHRSSVTLDALSAAFKRLADLLRSGEQAITTYELTISGLVPALLLCLSAAHAGHWNCPVVPVGPDATTNLLWYLRERRRVFLQHLFPPVGPITLGLLSRRVVHALELAEHLPLRLFALADCFDASQSSDDRCAPSGSEQQTGAGSHTNQLSSRPTVTIRSSDAHTPCSVASLPLGLIRASQTAVQTEVGGGSESKGLSETQQFTDCMDETELKALFTFCPQLAPRSDANYVVPGMHQIDSRLMLELYKMKDDASDRDGDRESSGSDSTELVDWTNNVVHVNPLVTAAQLERFVWRMSVKQWYNKPRTELCYWNQLTDALRTTHKGITFSPPVNGISSIDSVGGVIDWLATDGNTRPIEQWANPALIGLVTVAASVSNLTLGRAASILGPRSGTLIGGYPVRCSGIGAVTRSTRATDTGGSGRGNNHKSKFGGASQSGRGSGSDEIKAWFAVDLGLQLIPTAYSMAFLREAENFAMPVAPRNWNLEASNDGIHWTVLRRHVDDTSIQSLSGSRATWSLTENGEPDNPKDAQSTEKGWRFFKVQMTNVNANGGRELALGGLEFYGTVCAAHESVFSSGHLAQLINRAASPKVGSRALLQASSSSYSTKAGGQFTASSRDRRRSSPKDSSAQPEDSETRSTHQARSAGCLDTTLESTIFSESPPTTTGRDDSDQVRLVNEDEDEDDDDTAEAEEHSRDDTLSERLFGGLGLLDLTSSDTNLLQYLDGLLSSDRSSEGIRRFLNHIRTQDSTDDESLSHFASPKKLSVGSPSAACDASDHMNQDTVPATLDSDTKGRTEDSITKAPITWTRTAVTELSIEPQQKPGHARSREGDSSLSRSPISEKSPQPSTTDTVSGSGCTDPLHGGALHFIDQDAGTDPCRSQTSNVSGPFELDPEDAEALEFADTVEAIIESNICSSDSPFPRGLAPACPKRFGRLTSSGTERSKGQRTLDCWFIQEQGPDHAEEEGVASEPEYTADPASSSQHQLRSSAVVAAAHLSADSRPADEDSTPPAENSTEQSVDAEQPAGRTTVVESSYYPSSFLRQASSPAKINLSPKPPQSPSGTDDPYKISIFATSKSNRQLRRRLRRPRPRGAIMSSSVSHLSATDHHANRSTHTSQPLSWDEAGDLLRLPPGLIPVFDPNPGWTNAPATTPFALCNPPSADRKCGASGNQFTATEEQRVALFLMAYDKSTCVAQVPMRNKDTTLFRYIQELSECHEENAKKNCSIPIDNGEKSNDTCSTKIGESRQDDESSGTALTLKLGYRLWHPSDEADSTVGNSNLDFHTKTRDLLSRDDLRLTPAMQYPIEYTESGIKLTMLNEVVGNSNDGDSCEIPSQSSVTTPEQLLHLLTLLYQLSGLAAQSTADWHRDIDDLRFRTSQQESGATQATSTPIRPGPETRQSTTGLAVTSSSTQTAIRPEDFVSRRLTRKLLRQIRDPLAMSSGALPDWCLSLTCRLTALFSFDSRLELLKAHAFGPARSVIWLQNQPPSKTTGYTGAPLSRSHSEGSSTSSGTHRIRRSALTAAHTLVLSSLTGQRGSGQVLGPSTASDVLLLRPSILSQLTTSSAGGCQQLDQPSHTDNPVLGTLFSSLGLTLPPGFSLRSQCSRDLNTLWNCLLARTARGAHGGAQTDNSTTTHVGRLHKEFVRLPRMPRELVGTGEPTPHATDPCSAGSDGFVSTFWDWAACLMEEHASRKAELEIQFIGEDGTGLGPTLEFYSLLAAELRRRDGLMWVVDDLPVSDDDSQDDSRPALPTVASKATIGSQSQSGLDQSVSEDSFDLSVEANAYVNTAHGLFPAAWPQDRVPEHVLYRFYILGITVAKCLQDNRRIDLPFSPPLLKLLSCYGSIARTQHGQTANTSESTADDRNENGPLSHGDFSAVAEAESVLNSITPNGSSVRSPLSDLASSEDSADCDLGEFVLSLDYRRLHEVATGPRSPVGTKHWLSNLLGLEDLQLIYPERARFLRQAVQFCRKKYRLHVQVGPHNVDPDALDKLAVEVFGCSMEEMYLTMEFSPPSKMFAGTSIRLRDVYDWESESSEKASLSPRFDLPEDTEDAGSQTTDLMRTPSEEAEPVTVHNIEQYLIRTLNYCLDKGIRKQIDAFQAGFERVLPLNWLALFNGTELGQLIAGDSVAHWSREDLLAYTVPCFGFTHQSPTYQMLINVLCSFNALERRAFLQFTTGCSSLPPGGLKNLHPRLRVVRKDAGAGALPSVNTCVHYLKLPEYQNEMELRTVLLRATREIGFYLN